MNRTPMASSWSPSSSPSSSSSSSSSSGVALDPRSAPGVARGLGWFSLALGAALVLLPDMMTRATGTPRRTGMLLRLAGLREIAAGVGLLASHNPRPWMWARVGGDVLDVAALAVRLRPDNPRVANSALSLAAVLGVTALDFACARALDRQEPAPSYDYSGRRGLPKSPDEMRGAALSDFLAPQDMQIPRALAPYSES